MKKICVIGLGYVGLPLALVIAENGGEVIGVDVDVEKINNLKKGNCFLEEDELISLWNSQRNKIKFTNEIENADLFLISVPTPLINGTETCDFSFIDNATKDLAKVLKFGNSIVLTSTCPVGTTLRLGKKIYDYCKIEYSNHFELAYCPERLYPGDTYFEIKHNWHLIGGLTKKSTDIISSFYEKFITKKIIKTNAKVAEFSKLVENAYRDVNIAFANEIASLAEKKSVDVKDIIVLANKHPRVDMLSPGIGVGGHCLPIDPWFLNPSNLDNSNSVIRAARQINDHRPKIIAGKIVDKLISILLSKSYQKNIPIKVKEDQIHVLLLGYTYKEQSKDLRESPALKIEEYLNKKGFSTIKYDPLINAISKKELLELNKKSLISILLVKHQVLIKQIDGLDYIDWEDI